MTSKIALITVMSAALAATGLMAKTETGVNHRQSRLDHLSATLNLTVPQRQQAHSIFMAAREQARPVRQELKGERQSVEAAIQAGRPAAEVEQLARNEGPALAKLAGMRAGTWDQFYAVLTPAQRQTIATLHQERHQRRADGAGL